MSHDPRVGPGVARPEGAVQRPAAACSRSRSRGSSCSPPAPPARPAAASRRRPEEGRHPQAARLERHLQPRPGERVLHGQLAARARLHAAARLLRQRRRRSPPRRRSSRTSRPTVPTRGNGISADGKTYTLPPAQGREVEHLAAAAGDRRRLRARVQAAVQPGLAGRRAGLLHEHHRRAWEVLRRHRQGQADGSRRSAATRTATRSPASSRRTT